MELLSATQRINEIDNLSFLFYFYFFVRCCDTRRLYPVRCVSLLYGDDHRPYTGNKMCALITSRLPLFIFAKHSDFEEVLDCVWLFGFFFWTSISAISVAGQMKRKKKMFATLECTRVIDEKPRIRRCVWHSIICVYSISSLSFAFLFFPFCQFSIFIQIIRGIPGFWLLSAVLFTGTQVAFAFFFFTEQTLKEIEHELCSVCVEVVWKGKQKKYKFWTKIKKKTKSKNCSEVCVHCWRLYFFVYCAACVIAVCRDPKSKKPKICETVFVKDKMRRLRCLLFKCTTNVYTSYGIDASTGRNVLLFPSYGTQWPRMLRTAKRRRCGPSERIDRKRCAICTANSSRRTNNGNITINYGKQQDRTRTIIIVRTQPLPIDCCNFFVVVFRSFFHISLLPVSVVGCHVFDAAVAAAVSTSDIALLLVRKHIQLSEQQRMRACMCAFDRANKRPSPVRALSHTHTTTTTTQNNIIFFPNKNVHNAIN